MEVTTIVAVRHGETTWNRQRRVQGWAPARLTDRGREQAKDLGARLAAEYEIDRILASDLHRTEETVNVLLDHVDVPVSFESAWRERDFGVYQGMSVEELSERFPEHDLEAAGREAAKRRPDSGERLVDVRERVLEQWEATVADRVAEETVLIVTHGGPIRLVLGHLKGLDIVEAITGQSQGNCSITEFKIDPTDGAVEIIRENDTSHR